MGKQQLLRTLEQLHHELSQTEGVDPETVARLEEAIADLRRSLEDSDAEPAEEEPVSGLKDLLLRYEAEHPQLSASIGRVADALAAMGF